MNNLRKCAAAIVLLLALVAVFGARGDSASLQDREAIGAPPSAKYLLGTDDLGRDRLARLIQGTRVSILLAPAAALLSTFLAAAIGGLAGYAGGRVDRFVVTIADLFLSLPWLLLLLAVRALLPLNTSPLYSVLLTFLLLGCLGWANPGRILRAAARTAANSDYLLHARACGVSNWRLFWRMLVPNLLPILLAQFWIAVPVYVLSEANLGLLGLGVSEPLASLGSLLRELASYSTLSQNPVVFAPVAVLITLAGCLHVLVSPGESRSCS
jgi:peptide/nickel transport system permease protein